MKIKIIFHGDDDRELILKGRSAWTLSKLKEAGQRGITVLDNPAPALACYIHKLRLQGIEISTEMERHGGEFAGHHARYRLQTELTMVFI